MVLSNGLSGTKKRPHPGGVSLCLLAEFLAYDYLDRQLPSYKQTLTSYSLKDSFSYREKYMSNSTG